MAARPRLPPRQRQPEDNVPGTTHDCHEESKAGDSGAVSGEKHGRKKKSKTKRKTRDSSSNVTTRRKSQQQQQQKQPSPSFPPCPRTPPFVPNLGEDSTLPTINARALECNFMPPPEPGVRVVDVVNASFSSSVIPNYDIDQVETSPKQGWVSGRRLAVQHGVVKGSLSHFGKCGISILLVVLLYVGHSSHVLPAPSNQTQKLPLSQTALDEIPILLRHHSRYHKNLTLTRVPTLSREQLLDMSWREKRAKKKKK